MGQEDFVESRGQLFAYRGGVEQYLTTTFANAQRRVAELSEEEVLGLVPNEFGSTVAEEFAIPPPRVDIEHAQLRDCGEMMVDCTGAAGIQFSSTEFGAPILRKGRRLSMEVPASGEVVLLKGIPSAGAAPVQAEIEGGMIVRTWTWPEVKGTEAFNTDLAEFKVRLETGAGRVADDVKQFNERLSGRVADALRTRREEVMKAREFLAGIAMPLTRNPAAPVLRPPPGPVRKNTPVPAAIARETKGLSEPELAELYEHVLEVIRAVGRGWERTPGSFTNFEEEDLRDHLVVTLNTHYLGRTTAEAFNRGGHTDVLVRVGDRNAFIGECKWWSGESDMNKAFEQLYGYVTWRDSLLALIFYVRNKDFGRVLNTAREAVEARDDFIGWARDRQEDGELQARIQWGGDQEREATITLLFFHIAEEPS
jgi:hypothetical protein